MCSIGLGKSFGVGGMGDLGTLILDLVLYLTVKAATFTDRMSARKRTTPGTGGTMRMDSYNSLSMMPTCSSTITLTSAVRCSTGEAVAEDGSEDNMFGKGCCCAVGGSDIAGLYLGICVPGRDKASCLRKAVALMKGSKADTPMRVTGCSKSS